VRKNVPIKGSANYVLQQENNDDVPIKCALKRAWYALVIFSLDFVESARPSLRKSGPAVTPLIVNVIKAIPPMKAKAFCVSSTYNSS